MTYDTVRVAKSGLVAMAGAYALLAGIDNLFDYQANLPFVQHVLAMDTTFRDPAIMWRAIRLPIVGHVAYILIIATELAVGVVAFAGAIAMVRGRSGRASYERGKRWAILALMLGIALWFGGFLIVAGEWFAMWQSPSYNAQAAAFQYVVPFLLILGIVIPAEPVAASSDASAA